MLGTLSVPGRPTSLDNSRARTYCACSRCGWGVVWTFFLSSIFSLFFLPVFRRWPDKTEILSQRVVKPKTTNQSNQFKFCFLIYHEFGLCF